MTDNKENRIVWVDLEVGTVVNIPSIKRQRRGQRLMQVYGHADAAADAWRLTLGVFTKVQGSL